MINPVDLDSLEIRLIAVAPSSSDELEQTFPTPSAKPVISHPWEPLAAPEREPSIRLNLDIPIRLNDLLAAEARKLRTSKSELVRRLLEWAVDKN